MTQIYPKTSFEEEFLVSKLQVKNKEAISMIYQMYGQTLLGVIYRIVGNREVAEDVLQDAMVRIWKNGPSYQSDKGRLFTWMLNICRNRAIDVLRSKDHRKNLQNKGTAESLLANAPEQKNVFNPDTIDLKDEIDKLSLVYREALRMVYYLGYTHKDAAKQMGLPIGTLKSRIRTAFIKLRTVYVESEQAQTQPGSPNFLISLN